MGYWRFWEYNNGQGYDSGPIDDRCDVDPDGTSRLFKVMDTWDSTRSTYALSIYDCGTTDWSTCTKLSSGPSLGKVGYPLAGTVASEVNYGGGPCTNDFAGSSTQPTKFGNGTNPIEGQVNAGGTWSAKNLVYEDDAGCGDYRSPTHTDQIFETYDTRN